MKLVIELEIKEEAECIDVRTAREIQNNNDKKKKKNDNNKKKNYKKKK